MSPHSKINALGSDPIGKLLLKYSLPAIAGVVVFSLYNIIDSIFIGQGVGALAISGLAVAFPMMNLTFALGLLVGIGGAAVSSIRIGQQHIRDAFNVLGNVTILNVIAGLFLGITANLVLDETLIWFGASEQTLPYARDFMSIILYGLPITYTFFNLNHVMRATGYPNKAMYSMILTVCVNIIAAPLFIFTFDLGMKGAAWATIISQIAGVIWVLCHFANSNSLIHFKRGIYRLRKRLILNIVSIGLSPCLMNLCASVVVILINNGLIKFGGDMAVGAHGIINRILTLFVMIVVGLTQGMQPIIGFNYGAKNYARVKEVLKYGLIAGTAVTTIAYLTCELCPSTLVHMFTDEPELVRNSITGMRIGMFCFPIVGIQIVIGNFFQATGKAAISIFLAVSRQLLFLVPFLLILPRYFQLNGIWASLPSADILSCSASVIALICFLRKLKNKPEPSTAEEA